MADQRTPKPTLDRVKARLAELRKRGYEPRTNAPAEISTVAWPRDLNDDGGMVLERWEADPTGDT